MKARTPKEAVVGAIIDTRSAAEFKAFQILAQADNLATVAIGVSSSKDYRIDS